MKSMEAFAAELAVQTGVEMAVLPWDAAWSDDKEPAMDGNDVRLYATTYGTLAVLRPCRIAVGALTVRQSPSEELLGTLTQALRTNPEFVRNQVGEHLNLYLSAHEDDSDVCCLYCHAPNLSDGARLHLFYDLLDALSACAFYRIAEGDALCFCASMDQLRAALDRVRPLLAAYGALAGFCGPYERAVSAHGCLEKARRAALTATNSIQSFSVCRYSEFWREAARVATDGQYTACDFCHETLWRILTYDRVESTDYADSLRAYLDAGRRLRESALALGVHRNTMAYRIRRIEELFALDTRDDALCFELQFSYCIVDHLPPVDMGVSSGFFAPAVQRTLWSSLRGEAADTTVNGARMRLLLIDTGEANDAQRADLLARLRAMDWTAATAFDDDVIAVAVPEDDTAAVEAASFVLRSEGLRGVLSQTFKEDRLTIQMRLMKMFLFYKRSFGELSGLFRADRFCSTLFFLFLQRHMDLITFCCDEVVRVMDYDYARDTTLSSSLYAYLTHYTDLKDAAKDACIHRNTLDYQIKKVLALLGGEPVDGQLRFEMMCSFRILSTIGTTIP